MLRLATSVLLALGLASCSVPITGELTGDCSDLTHAESDYFDEVMLPEFFDVHCTVCHSQDLEPGLGLGTRRGAPRSFNYDTVARAALSPGATWTRVADRTMPPMGREVNDTEAALLLNWANCIVAKEGVGDDDDSAGDDDDSAR
jgi:mono/diheme cytochrome c family protein